MMLSKNAVKITPSATLEITDRANKLKAQGIDVISFGAGEPDFATPQFIKDAAMEALNKNYTKYTASSGIKELREAICKKLLLDNGLNYTADQIVVSNGAKHSIFNAMLAILDPGDEVIIPSPYWVSYPEMVKLMNCKPVIIKTKPENNFKISADEFRRSITERTKLIIINTPNNPTGAIYSKEELSEIAKMAVENNIFIISDEIYEKLIYEKKHVSIASINEKVKNLTVVINGMSKTYSMTGWRIGYSASNSEIANVINNIQSHTTSNPNTIAQYASIVALNEGNDFIEKIRIEFEKRKNLILSLIDNITGLKYITPQGAFYVYVNIDYYIGKSYKNGIISNSLDMAKYLIDEANVAIIPGIAFGNDNYIRLSYATSAENIKNGLERIRAALEKLA
ncbi:MULTISPECIES: pyridoxal phosphate-dependent aminotransferase [Thermoanaerobacterium]|uniref:Aminotransferase n=2 Tax=Thermoanaerobacterium TaxID=28895 RepID=W9EEH8_9THEO|nr:MULTISPECIES: pyridoxal phosphate-dependent aminotransferase [Thermoanaerobacterium]AFK87163.1 aminotransferase class I and II [Thermoanaerobacterium saccharolyticum JW/SL-YS485]ETO38164.1 class I and II aminotransferase [Thermoanaerobacterium aotearoense SCUT27]